MKASLKSFTYDKDFIKVRNFLSKTYAHYQGSLNWRIERWEYAFHFVAPFLANWGEDPPSRQSAEEAIRFLETLTGLWETPSGEIAGVVNIEHPDLTHPGFGEFFIQRHPEYSELFPEMLDFAESKLVDPSQNRLYIYIAPDDQPLRQLLEDRGFAAFPEQTEAESVLDLSKKSLPDQPNLPEGYKIQSMADDNNLEERCRAFGRAFNHPDPLEWPSVISYDYLQKAPDYRKDRDIVVVAPDGTYASFALIWFDEYNKLASLEPVGTQPEFRRMGLAKEAIYEGIRRVKAKGAQQVVVGSTQAFYLRIGFVPTETKIRFAKYNLQ